MIKIANVMDVAKVEKMQKYPKEVIETIQEITAILDEEYGEYRDVFEYVELIFVAPE